MLNFDFILGVFIFQNFKYPRKSWKIIKNCANLIDYVTDHIWLCVNRIVLRSNVENCNFLFEKWDANFRVLFEKYIQDENFSVLIESTLFPMDCFL